MRILHCHRPNERHVDQLEQAQIEPDAEAENQQAGGGKARRLTQAAQAELQIAEGVFEPGPAPLIARCSRIRRVFPKRTGIPFARDGRASLPRARVRTACGSTGATPFEKRLRSFHTPSSMVPIAAATRRYSATSFSRRFLPEAVIRYSAPYGRYRIRSRPPSPSPESRASARPGIEIPPRYRAVRRREREFFVRWRSRAAAGGPAPGG